MRSGGAGPVGVREDLGTGSMGGEQRKLWASASAMVVDGGGRDAATVAGGRLVGFNAFRRLDGDISVVEVPGEFPRGLAAGLVGPPCS